MDVVFVPLGNVAVWRSVHGGETCDTSNTVTMSHVIRTRSTFLVGLSLKSPPSTRFLSSCILLITSLACLTFKQLSIGRRHQ